MISRAVCFRSESWFEAAAVTLQREGRDPPRPMGIKKELVRLEVSRVSPLHEAGTTKPTALVELAPCDSESLDWEPGDSLAIFPENDPREVENVARLFGESTSDFLAWQADLRGVDRRLIAALAERSTDDPFRRELTAAASSREAMQTADVQKLAARSSIGVLAGARPAELFRRQRPRLYTIAGAGESSDGSSREPTLQLAVALVEFPWNASQRRGVASSWLLERATPGTRLWGFVQPNRRFHFDQPKATPQIFVGAGTGIAPFRAELQRRSRLGVRGPIWLFFGARHRATDRPFGSDVAKWLAEGTLSRFDAAFSRDANPQYVQDRIAFREDDFADWIERGAVISICGSARMAPEVERTIGELLARRAGESGADRGKFVTELKAEGRLRIDAY